MTFVFAEFRFFKIIINDSFFDCMIAIITTQWAIR